VEPHVRATIHDRMRLALNPERLHFFDMQSEAAI
jgi:multiple sugar transport system ATP-binding protein